MTMSIATLNGPTEQGSAADDFTTSEGLRSLLTRLHDAGAGAWERDPAAAELMLFAAEKYASLARKHGLDPWEAASGAFDVMRTKAARRADDPWAVITHAVRITCVAEERGQGLLCSTHQARRPHVSACHDAERFGDRTNPLIDFHPAFHVTDHHDTGIAGAEGGEGTSTTATLLVEDAIGLFRILGWPGEIARASVEHVCAALARAGGRQNAHETLRRDQHARASLDLPRKSWTALLKVLLGNPNPVYAPTNTGRGVLVRLLIGEPLTALLGDDDLVLAVSQSAPRVGGR